MILRDPQRPAGVRNGSGGGKMPMGEAYRLLADPTPVGGRVQISTFLIFLVYFWSINDIS